MRWRLRCALVPNNCKFFKARCAIYVCIFLDIKDVHNSYFDKYLSTTKNVLYSVNQLNVLITLQHKIYRKCDPDYWKEGTDNKC